MDYGKMIQIALFEMYRYKYNMVLIFEKDNYVIIRYPKEFYSVRAALRNLIDSDKVVLAIKDHNETRIIQGIRSIYRYIADYE